jgi:cell division septation protein DedD
MPGFDPNILRDEEKLGGFEPNSSGDETFLLEQLPSYPGKPGTPAATTEGMPGSTAPVEEPVVPFPVDDSAMEEMTDPDEYRRVPEQPLDTIAVPEETPQGMYNDPLVLDDSLIALLKADLADSKKRKEKEVETPVNTAGQFPPFSAEDYRDDEAGDGTGVELDLSSIDAEHPSTYGIDRSLPPNRPEEPVVVPPVEERREPEKKRRRFFPWPLVAAVALLLLLTLGAVGYFYLVPKNKDHAAALHDSSAVSERHEHTAVETHDHGATHGAAGHEGDHKEPDTVVIATSPEHGTATIDSTHTTSGALADNNASAGHAVKSDPGISAANDKTHEGHKSPQTTPVPPAVKEPVVNKRGSAVKETPVVTETKPKSKPYKPQTPPPASAQGEYVIQVYSSPSADDADEWLQQLRKRSINDGFISSQSVRGQTWYRVRFGKFATRDEADARASQLGFSNVWVVRVK